MVPAGVEEIKVEISGQAGETVDAALRGPDGKTVTSATNVSDAKILSYTRPETNKSEVWSILIRNAIDDHYLRLGAPLLPLISNSPENLLVPKGSIQKIR